jgi:hypothetical protein
LKRGLRVRCLNSVENSFVSGKAECRAKARPRFGYA